MKTMSSFRHLLPFFLAVGVLLWAQAVVADMRSGIDCTCSEDDRTYQQGAKAKKPFLDCVPPINPDYCRSPNDRYCVTAAGTNQITLTVKTSGGQTVLTTEPFPFTDSYWGFSPDDDRFVLHYYTAQGIDAVVHIRLYNLLYREQDNRVALQYQHLGRVGQRGFYSFGYSRQRYMGTTIRASICLCGDVGNSASIGPAISGNGRLVGFTSHANNLLEGLGDINNAYDIFIHELPLVNACEADYDGDRDVDGTDLKTFAEDFEFDKLEAFALEFGRTTCLDPAP